MSQSQSFIHQSGSRYFVVKNEDLTKHDSLPQGNYVVQENPMSGQLYLEKTLPFELPGELYGNTSALTQRILTTFKSRSSGTGVMLSGEKGSGKSLLAKNVSVEAAKLGIPTVIVTNPWKGESFNRLIQDIPGDCIVFFDEFEKVYDREDQEEMLSLLDGVFNTHKLFLFTCNDRYGINQHMINRPGRIFYWIEYKGLDEPTIRDYCNRNLDNKQHIDSVLRFGTLFQAFNFDMLKALVEEMNRYQLTARDVIDILNARPTHSDDIGYDYVIRTKGKKVVAQGSWYGNITNEIFKVRLGSRDSEDYDYDDDDDCGDDCTHLTETFSTNQKEKAVKVTTFTIEDVTSIEPKAGKYTLVNKEKYEATLTRKIFDQNRYYDAF